MEKIKQNLIPIVLVVVLLALVGVDIYQQKEISSFKRGPVLSEAVNQNPELKTNGLPDYIVDQKKNELINTVRKLEGTVADVSGSTIKVSAEVIDLEKIKEAASEDENTFAKKKITYTVRMNGKTEFIANKLGSIKVGDTIRVHTDDPVYSQNSIMATIVVSPVITNGQAAGKDQKYVSGIVQKIGNNQFTVKAADEKGNPTDKIYTIKTGSNTNFLKQEFVIPANVPQKPPQGTDQNTPPSNNAPVIPPNQTVASFSDIRAGDSVEAISSESVKNQDSFEAISVVIYIAKK